MGKAEVSTSSSRQVPLFRARKGHKFYIKRRTVTNVKPHLSHPQMASKAPPSNWQDLVAAKHHECEQEIPRDWLLSSDQLALANENPRLLDADIPRHSGLLSEVELDLTENYTANQLLVKLASGQVSSLAVTTAFCKRAAIAQHVVSTTYP